MPNQIKIKLFLNGKEINSNITITAEEFQLLKTQSEKSFLNSLPKNNYTELQILLKQFISGSKSESLTPSKQLKEEIKLAETILLKTSDNQQKELIKLEQFYQNKLKVVKGNQELETALITYYNTEKQKLIASSSEKVEQEQNQLYDKLNKQTLSKSEYQLKSLTKFYLDNIETAKSDKLLLNQLIHYYNTEKQKITELQKTESLPQKLFKVEQPPTPAWNQYEIDLETEKKIWAETHQVAIASLDGIKAGVRTLWHNFALDNRKAVDGWDAAWLAMKNTALQRLGEIITNSVWDYLFDTLFTYFTAGTSPIPMASTPGANIDFIGNLTKPISSNGYSELNQLIDNKLNNFVNAIENLNTKISGEDIYIIGTRASKRIQSNTL